MKRTLTACAAVTVAGIGVMVPAVAQAHEASGTVSCTAATIDYTKFPAGPQTAQWQLVVDQHLVAMGSFDFQGPTGTFTTPVSITDTAQHQLSLLTGWTTSTPGEGAPMHQVASATVTCGTTPPPPVVPVSPAAPPPSAAVTPPAGPAASTSGTQAGGAVSPAKRKTRPVPERCVPPTLGADIRGPKLIDAGKRVTVGVQVLNTSNAQARRVTATYPIPSGFSLAGTPHGGKMVNGALQVSLGNIGAHGKKSLRISLRADRETSGLQRTRVSVNARGILNRTHRTAPATCGATAASTTAIRVLPVAARVQPAVTG
jgi:hypothetical protein